MPRLSLSLLLLAGTFTFAQTPDHSRAISTLAQVTVSPENTLSANCPIGFFASRQATGQTMSASDTRQPGPAQGLHLVLSDLNTPAIQSIEVKVYGTSPKDRVLPVNTKTNDTVTKIFKLHRTSDNDSLRDADVWMHQVGSLSWVDLTSVTYADGTTWHATTTTTCRAVPSNLILVGSR